MTGANASNLSRRSLSALTALLLAAVSLVVPANPGGRSAAAQAAAATTDAISRAAATTTAAVDSALGAVREGAVKVIVQKHRAPATSPKAVTSKSARSAEQTVTELGGRVTLDLPIVDGFAATVPAAAIPALAANPEVRAISLDRVMQVNAGGSGSSTTKSVYRKSVKAEELNNAGFAGNGVTVAVIDTGVSNVDDLTGRLVTVTDDLTGATALCQNMTNESTCDDSFGHGTFIAGIIAGNGSSSGGKYKGVAPAARILSVKVAGRNGAADVSNVLAAIQWTVNFRDRYGVKVLNLSLGTNSTQSYHVDPLNYAVEKAWFAGITVVVSASNKGPDAGTIAKPGDDPFVVTVGAVDDRGSNGTGDDTLPNFSSRGPTAADGIAKPDVTAPGAHVVSLRAPGSAVDVQFPNFIDGSYRKASGTSFSAAVVSGTAAMVAEANPTATPDRIKYALTSTARRVASTDPMAVGSGEIDALNAALHAPPGIANVGVQPGTGTGTIDASRGTVYVTADDPMQTVVSGALTAQMLVFDPISYVYGDWSGAQWYGAQWYGAQWYGAQWYGAQWYGGQFEGAQWYGQMDGAQWYGAQWYGTQWYGGWE